VVGFTFFGSNGADEAYAWDWRPTRQAHYVVIPFITPRARCSGAVWRLAWRVPCDPPPRHPVRA